MTTDYAPRRHELTGSLSAHRLDALLVTSPANVRYLTGFTGSNAMALVTPGDCLLFTDPRYGIQARSETDVKVTVAGGPLVKAVSAATRRRRLKRLGFERGHIAWQTWEFLKERLGLGASLEPAAGLVERLRMVKSESEIARIRRSMLTACAAYGRAMQRVKPGLREIELAAEIDYQMRRGGAEGPAFETIVAAGPRSALPHARPTTGALAPNQLLLVDMGALQDGYTSDMTRTVYLGGNGQRKAKKLYQVVLEAQLAALDAVRPGVPAGAPDRAARAVLAKHGLEAAFVHSTGHGLGLEIHEAPRLGRKESEKLAAGMVITIEPGVYLEGYGGIRIEDTVLVTAGGCEVLTPLAKGFAEL